MKYFENMEHLKREKITITNSTTHSTLEFFQHVDTYLPTKLGLYYIYFRSFFEFKGAF